jgi:hypothetical protein
MCSGFKMIAELLTAIILLAFGTSHCMAAAQATAPAPKPAAAAPATATTQDLTGTWQGKMKVDANTSLTIQFTFARKPDGSWSATLNSPDNPAIRNMAANAVSFNNGAVKVDVTALNGSFSGTLKGRTLEGQWSQPGGALPLVMNPYEKPTIAKADLQTLLGGWHGPLTVPGGTFTLVIRFKQNDKGELQGTMGVVEQGGGEAPVSDIEFANSELSFKLPGGRGDYQGKYANGTFTGVLHPMGGPPNGMPVSLSKGDVAAPVYVLNLKTESFAALSGQWEGTLEVTSPQGQKVTLPMVLNIGTNKNGEIVGSFDSPAQNVKGIPVTAATVEGSKVTFKCDPLKAQYEADLANKTLTGQWTQGPVTAPLTLKKKS